MQTNLFSFFSAGSQPQKSTVDEELLSEPTKECSELHSENKPEALFGSPDSEIPSVEEEEESRNEQTSVGKRNLETQVSIRKRRRNDVISSDTERESISPNAQFVKPIPPPSQGDLPGAPRKSLTASRRPRHISELQELLAHEDSQEDLLDDKMLGELDKIETLMGNDDDEKPNPDTDSCIDKILDAARTEANNMMEEDAGLIFDRSAAKHTASQEESLETLQNKYLYQIPHLRDDMMWSKFVECYYRYRQVFSLPSWCDPEKMRDINGRGVEDPEFDFTHIQWPGVQAAKLGTDDRMHFTPAMKQYWDIKSANFDTIVFFKLGKFYEMFYTDSIIAQEILGLKWMGHDSKAHVGFPESSLPFYGKQLVDCGFKVCVVEQMETPDELQQRKSQGTADQNTVKRSICEVYTQGTLTHEKMLGALPSYLSSIYVSTNASSCKFAIVHLDVACCQGFFIAFDEPEMDTLCMFHNFISQWAPKEVLLDGSVSPETLKKVTNLIKSLDSCPQIRRQKVNRSESRLMAIDKIESQTKNTSLLAWIKTSDNENCIRAVEQLFDHLERTLLAERVLSCCSFREFDRKTQCLSLTAASLHNLDIFPGLFNKINFTSTKAGHRMLRQWLSYPLLNSAAILSRQKSVEMLSRNASTIALLKKGLSQFPDLERQFARLASQILKGGSEASGGGRGPVYFSETITKRISEYVSFLKHLEHIDHLFVDLQEELGKCDCRLFELVDSVYPRNGLLQVLERCFARVNREANLPVKGECTDYDLACDRVDAIKKAFDQYLHKGDLWQDLNSTKHSAVYVSSKYRYEVEVEENVWKKIKKEATMTSCRKGYVRFHTSWIHDQLNELQRAEYERDQYLYPWLAKEVKLLHQDSTLISHVLNILAEVDCINSLATYAQQLEISCAPVIKDEESSYIHLEKSYHPILANSHFIPNDIKVSSNQSIVLTGPNMGGKSTLSRQVALLTILAQIGSIIPATSCTLSPFHQIFTRIGLRDALAQDKSTFLIELEDVQQMLKFAAHRAILIIDEFGRGTNSKEGALLAASTLYYITRKIGCCVLFSTHFPLKPILQLMSDPSEENEVVLQHIKYQHLGAIVSIAPQFQNPPQINQDNIVFTYTLADGIFPESHGLRVAQLAGISSAILKT